MRLEILDLGMWDWRLRIADLASRHMAAPSLGHYAALSFVVIGRGQRIDFGFAGIRSWIS